MDKRLQIQQLINSRKLSTNEEYVLFEGALQALQACITIDDIAEICKAFCDDTKDDEVMFGIIHLIEQAIWTDKESGNRNNPYLQRLC